MSFAHWQTSPTKQPKSGAHSAGDTPVTIPNTEVKPSSGDNTVLWEDSTVPLYIEKPG